MNIAYVLGYVKNRWHELQSHDKTAANLTAVQVHVVSLPSTEIMDVTLDKQYVALMFSFRFKKIVS